MAATTPDLIITHTPDAGTTLYGTHKGDEASAIAKAHGYRWSRTNEEWYKPRSRNQAPKAAEIDTLKTALEAAGYTVQTDIDTHQPTFREREEARIAAEAQTVARWEAKVARLRGEVAAAEAQDKAATEAVPPMGQPVLVGHHSERGHRKALDRAHRTAEKAAEVRAELGDAEYKLKQAKAATGARYSLPSMGNKVREVKAKINAATRAGGDTTDLLTELAYWDEKIAQKQEETLGCTLSKENVKPGDLIQVGGKLVYKVARANAKTVTVWLDEENKITSSYRVAYEKITRHERPAN